MLQSIPILARRTYYDEEPLGYFNLDKLHDNGSISCSYDITGLVRQVDLYFDYATSSILYNWSRSYRLNLFNVYFQMKTCQNMKIAVPRVDIAAGGIS